MELRARIPSPLRRAATMAALVAVAAAATAVAAPTAHAKKKVKAPVVKKVSPLDVAVGETLTIRGKNFIKGRKRNTVVFKRKGARAVFAKADIGTKRMLAIKVPDSLQEFFATSAGVPKPTRFRIRVLSKRFAKKFTKNKWSPVISGPREKQVTDSLPDGDCDGDGLKNKNDADDDNDGLADDVETSLSLDPCLADTDGDGVLDKWEFDCDRNGVLNRDQADDDSDLLSDEHEALIGTDPCNADTDGDGVEDGYEWRSALDLNDDEYQQANRFIAYPQKMPYPNPGFKDADVDYDGDSLTLKEEYDLWVYTYTVTKTDPRSLDALSYSDGEQYSRYRRVDDGGVHNGRRVPNLPVAGYDKQQQFVAWAVANGYRSIYLQHAAETGLFWDSNPMALTSFELFDLNRVGGETAAERDYFDLDDDGYLSDDERDEDADGLSNYEESHGRMTPEYWRSCYSIEQPFHISYGGTRLDNADTDGDGVLDGADDQDHDDIPNVMELSRFAASGLWDGGTKLCTPADGLDPELNHPEDYGRVNPFNPCLPNRQSRTCPSKINSSTGAPFDGSPNWYSLN